MMTQQDQKVAAGAAMVVTVVGAIAALMAFLQLAEVRVTVPVMTVLPDAKSSSSARYALRRVR